MSKDRRRTHGNGSSKKIYAVAEMENPSKTSYYTIGLFEVKDNSLNLVTIFNDLCSMSSTIYMLYPRVIGDSIVITYSNSSSTALNQIIYDLSTSTAYKGTNNVVPLSDDLNGVSFFSYSLNYTWNIGNYTGSDNNIYISTDGGKTLTKLIYVRDIYDKMDDELDYRYSGIVEVVLDEAEEYYYFVCGHTCSGSGSSYRIHTFRVPVPSDVSQLTSDYILDNITYLAQYKGSLGSYLSNTEPKYGLSVGRYGDVVYTVEFYDDDNEFNLIRNSLGSTGIGTIKYASTSYPNSWSLFKNNGEFNSYVASLCLYNSSYYYLYLLTNTGNNRSIKGDYSDIYDFSYPVNCSSLIGNRLYSNTLSYLDLSNESNTLSDILVELSVDSSYTLLDIQYIEA